MKVSILQENLAKGVGVVSRIVSSKTQLPVLNNILIATDQGKIKLTATNLETGINLWLGGKVEKEGKITVPARVFSEMVSSLPKETVVLEMEKDKLKIVCGKYKAEINGINADEFPSVPSLKNQKEVGEKISLNREQVESSLGQVAAAAASDESRPVFTGVKLELETDKIRMAATDGYRLSVKTISGIKGIKKKQSLIIPARALMELVRVLGAAETEVKEITLAATQAERQLILSFGDGEVITRILEGEFPDFDKIIPSTHSTAIEMETEELAQAVKAAAVFAKDSANIVKFKIGKEGLLISANSPQVGTNEAEVAGKTTGEGGEIAFNCRYLTEMFNVIGGEKIVLEISGPLNPGVFRPLGDNSFLHIIMPVRVQG